MNIRENIENLEEKILTEFAVFSKNSKGRLHEESDVCNLRTAFQVDRGRIIHSKSFRRLKHKTQVFIAPENEHFRTRLTHTLEVSQIARNIARALRLNEDLTEAIALAHDLGHTPFGHAGESALNEIHPGGFKHFKHSLRVVDFLEKDGLGLNLTYEVRDGIVNHTKGELPFTLEGQVVRISDRIAYINHDIDDAIRANVLKKSQIPSSVAKILNINEKFKVDTLIDSLISNSKDGELKMSDEVQTAFYELHEFMYEFLYTDSLAKVEAKKVPYFIKTLYEYLLNHIEKLPPFMRLVAEKEGKNRAVCDYIASMTDNYAVNVFEKFFIPKSWSL